MEEQSAAKSSERQITHFFEVEDHEIAICESGGDLPELSLRLLLFERVDEGREEADALSGMFGRLHADPDGDMGLAFA
jgi:hypothetical protein